MTITNADIVGRLKLLADIHLKADSGTTTTAVNARLIDESNILNSYICFISGSNIGVDRVISGFAPTTGTISFTALSTTVSNTDEFCIVEKGYQSDVTQATLIVANDMRNKGYDIDLFINYQTQLKEMYIYKTIELICSSLMNDGTDSDAYYVNYNRFKQLYERESTYLIADYDLSEDGAISADEESANSGQVLFTR